MTSPFDARRSRESRRLATVVARGLTAGVTGTGVEVVATRIEAGLRRQPSPLDPSLMADRLSRTWLHRPLPPKSRCWIGAGMRWTYGPGWGVMPALLLEGRQGARWPLWGLGLGSAILAFELVFLPLSGATPPLREWGLRPVAEDALNTALYGLAAAAVCRLVTAPKQPR